jgi:hypothetical protein
MDPTMLTGVSSDWALNHLQAPHFSGLVLRVCRPRRLERRPVAPLIYNLVKNIYII